MKETTDTYENFSKICYGDARDCLNAKSYPMAIVSAATSVYLAMFSTWCRLHPKALSSGRVDNFACVEEKMKKHNEKRQIADDVTWLRHARNAIMHPNECILPKYELDKDQTPRFIVNNDIPKIKRDILMATLYNEQSNLHAIADNAIKTTSRILLAFGIPHYDASSNQINEHIEKRIKGMTGTHVDLEHLHDCASQHWSQPNGSNIKT